MDFYHIPKNEQPLDELYAVLSEDEKGEGIVSMMTPSGGMPLVFGHQRNLENALKIAEKISKETGKKLKLVKYTKTEVMRVIE